MVDPAEVTVLLVELAEQLVAGAGAEAMHG